MRSITQRLYIPTAKVKWLVWVKNISTLSWHYLLVLDCLDDICGSGGSVGRLAGLGKQLHGAAKFLALLMSVAIFTSPEIPMEYCRQAIR